MRVMRWQGEKGGSVVRWQGGKGERVVRWLSGRFLVLFEGGESRVSPRFHFFCFSKKRSSRVCLRYSCMAAEMVRFSLDLTQAVENVAGCESVWNSKWLYNLNLEQETR